MGGRTPDIEFELAVDAIGGVLAVAVCGDARRRVARAAARMSRAGDPRRPPGRPRSHGHPRARCRGRPDAAGGAPAAGEAPSRSWPSATVRSAPRSSARASRTSSRSTPHAPRRSPRPPPRLADDGLLELPRHAGRQPHRRRPLRQPAAVLGPRPGPRGRQTPPARPWDRLPQTRPEPVAATHARAARAAPGRPRPAADRPEPARPRGRSPRRARTRSAGPRSAHRRRVEPFAARC